ncbi:MAG: DUF2927 domain-containing protein [Paracoccaceae bacterium]
MATKLGHILRVLLLLSCLGAVSSCDITKLNASVPAGAESDQDTQQSPESLALSRYYSRVQAGLLTQGLLRQDGGGPDVPFTQRNLVDNFVRIALFDEYTNIGGRIVARQTPSKLDKWQGPIRMSVEFGDSVGAAQQVKDRSNIAKFGARLARLTGLTIRQVQRDANFHVFVVNENERRALGPRITEILPGIDAAALRTVVEMPRSTFCLVFALDPGDDGTYSQALAIIRGEHPDLMRLSCIHEEIAQGLGLSNDSPAARPSIFNDDEEFGLLTRHDELLLRMLYDPRMIPGMDAAAARVQAEIIAAELMAGQI